MATAFVPAGTSGNPGATGGSSGSDIAEDDISTRQFFGSFVSAR